MSPRWLHWPDEAAGSGTILMTGFLANVTVGSSVFPKPPTATAVYDTTGAPNADMTSTTPPAYDTIDLDWGALGTNTVWRMVGDPSTKSWTGFRIDLFFSGDRAAFETAWNNATTRTLHIVASNRSNSYTYDFSESYYDAATNSTDQLRLGDVAPISLPSSTQYLDDWADALWLINQTPGSPTSDNTEFFEFKFIVE